MHWQLSVLSLAACIPQDPEGSIFGGNLGDSLYCMPGPPSVTFKGFEQGDDKVLLCDEELDNGTFVSECDNSLYIRTPESASSETYTTANVIPGMDCRPNTDFIPVSLK